MPAEIEVIVLELRRAHRYSGARRRHRPGQAPPPQGDLEALGAGRALELWQMDVVGGFLLADGAWAKALTGIDDHSGFCVSARLMARERTELVCDGFLSARRAHGVPQQVLTDNGEVFTR